MPQGISRVLDETTLFRPQFRDILSDFMLIMLPRSVTTGMVWGLTYLVVQVMTVGEHSYIEHQRHFLIISQVYVKRDDTASKYAKMILDIRRQLALVKRDTPRDENIDPAEKQKLRHGYIVILEALIQFWRDSVQYLRGVPSKEMSVTMLSLFRS
jgi:hypothetical protein